MNPSDAIKEVGRGRNSARPLDRSQAGSIFAQMLDGSMDPLCQGALMMAWRMKGESVDELAGFLDATHASMLRPEALAVNTKRPLVVIPSYNGARSRPNLVPLLAFALRDAGLQVLVHGVPHDPRRTTSARILAALGEASCLSFHAALEQLRATGLAFIGIDTLAPALARVLELRWTMGVRSSAHTVVKMLDPIPSAALRLVSVTHPDYLSAMRAYYAAYPSSVLLMRGTEGEPVVRTSRPQAIEWLREGRVQIVLAADDRDTSGGQSLLPEGSDTEGTARWIEQVIAGDLPMPEAIAAQVAAIVRSAHAVFEGRGAIGPAHDRAQSAGDET